MPAKNYFSPKKTEVTDPSKQKIVYAIAPDTFQYLGNAAQLGFQNVMSYWQKWNGNRQSTFNVPTLNG